MMKRKTLAIEFADPWTPPKPRNTREDHFVTTLRTEYDLTQEAAAEALGVSRAMIAAVETHRRELGKTIDEVREILDDYTAGREEFHAQIRNILKTKAQQ